MTIVNVKFSINDNIIDIAGQEGQTILDLKHMFSELECLECACEGSLACSTCHVIVDDEHYEKTGEITEEEEDMLDLAFGLTKTSRLGCQVKLTPELEGTIFKIPVENRNFSHKKAGDE